MCVYLCIYLRQKSLENTKLVGIQILKARPVCDMAQIYQEALVYDVYVLNSVLGAILANHSGHVAAVQSAPIKMRTKWLCQDPCQP